MRNLRAYDIIDYVKKQKRCSFRELMDRFSVSSATIHRDVADLVSRNVLVRMRGGVAFNNNSAMGVRGETAHSSYHDRSTINRTAKERIAKKALSFVQEGDILFLDSSTTVAFLAEELTQSTFTNLTIVTNGVTVAQTFFRMPQNYVCISLGGTYDKQLNAFLGQGTLRRLEELTITKAFISAFGYNEKSATTNHEDQCGLFSRILEKASSRYLLIDKSKRDRAGLFKIYALGGFDQVIHET